MVRYWAFSIFQSTAWDKNAPKTHKSKTGVGAETPHPSQSEGSTSRWFHPGDSQGGSNSSGSELFPPLSRTTFLTFLPEQESKAAGGQCPLTISHGGFLRIVFSLTRPVSLLRCSRCKDQSPPCQRGVVWHSQTGGILRGGRFPHGSVVIGSARCESLSHAYGVPAPFRKGAFGCGIGTAQTMNPRKAYAFRGAFYCFREAKIPRIRVFIWAAASSPP